MEKKKHNPVDFPEISLFDLLGHEIENFKPWFKKRFSKIRRTLILSPYASFNFGVQTSGRDVFIGVPDKFFETLYASRIYSITVINGQPGFYILFSAGSGRSPVALRVFCTKKTAARIAKCDQATLSAIDANGEAFPISDRNQFTLTVQTRNGLDWE